MVNERCGNSECGKNVAVNRETIRYDGYVFCCTACRNRYSLTHDGEAIGESGVHLFKIDQAKRNGPGGGNR